MTIAQILADTDHATFALRTPQEKAAFIDSLPMWTPSAVLIQLTAAAEILITRNPTGGGFTYAALPGFSD